MDNITAINLACPLQYLSIGYVGETGARPVAFDFSAWATEYGAGVLQLLLLRPGDAEPYPVYLSIDGTTATWTPNATDTEKTGQGQAQLVYTVGGTVVKDAIFRVLIAPSLGAAGDPPEPYETWLERLTELAAETQQSALDAAESAAEAEQSAEDAAAAKTDAETAKTAAETAAANAGVSAGSAAEKAAQAAQSAQTAEQGASAAQQSAEDAQAALEAARLAADAAGTFADAAESSKTAAALSASGAAQAKTDAETAAGAAGTSATAAAGSAAAAAAAVTEVETKGAEQIAAINAAGAVQVQRVEDAAEEVLEKIPDLQAEIDGKAPAIIETAGPAAVASFDDAAAGMPLKSLVVNVLFEQEGTGNPAPDNIRNITAYTGATLFQAGEDTSTPTETTRAFHAEAGTVAEAAWDVLDGVLSYTRGFVELDGSEDEAWDLHDELSHVFKLTVPAMAQTGVATWRLFATNQLYNASRPSGAANVQDHGLYTSASHVLYVRFDEFDTVAQLRAWLAQHPLQVVYPIQGRPLTAQLDPADVEPLPGVNNLWSDAGTVTVEYPADTKTYVDAQAAALSGEIETLSDDVDALEGDVVTLQGDVSDISALPIISPPDVETLVEDGEYTDEAKAGIQQAIGLPGDFRLIKEIAIAEESNGVYVTTDADGNPFALDECFVLFENIVGTATGSGAIVINGTSEGSNVPYLTIESLYNTTAQSRAAYLRVLGGRFFGLGVRSTFANAYGVQYVAANRNAFGWIGCSKIESIKIYSLNGYKITSAKITIFGR